MLHRTPYQTFRSVILALIIRELKTRFGGRWIGAFWTVFEPLAHTVLMVIVMRSMRSSTGVNGVDFPVFLATGMVPFFIFRNLALRLPDAIGANRALFAYRPVKPIDTLISRTILEVAIYAIVFVLTFGILAWMGHEVIPQQPLEWFGMLALLVAFGFSLGLVFAVAVHRFPRLRSILSLSFMPLYMLSGVMIPVRAIPPYFMDYLIWNPLLHLMEEMRHYFFPGYELVNGINFLYPASIGLVALTLGLALYRVRRQQLVMEVD